MASVTLEVPDDLMAKLKSTGSQIGDRLRVAAAFSLCSRGELSTSQAACLAGMTYGDLLEAAAWAKVVLFPVDLEELKEQATRGFALGRQRSAHHPAGQGGLR